MTAESQGKAAADKFRRDHHLGTQPIGDLVAMIEQTTGVDVAVVQAEPDEHGLTMRDPDREAVFIAVALTPHPMRQRSSLAHELGHFVFEDWSTGRTIGTHRPVEEKRADVFARHLLIPTSGLKEVLGHQPHVGLATLSRVVQRFLVSPKIAAIALHQADYIAESTKTEWMTRTAPALAAQFGWADQYHVLQTDSLTRRAPQRLLARAIQGYLQNVVPVQAIATLRGSAAAKVEAELRDAGLSPGDPAVVWMNADDLPDVDIDLTELDRAPEASSG
jgi:Zn-dependent peptidase ImmA (M78 family)